jgi:hypothetical protein
MLNLTPNSPNNLIIYADTVSPGMSVGNFYLIVFTNTYSKQTFAVVPRVLRRNTRFVELEVTTVGVNGQNLPLDGDIYLFPEGNFTYMVFNTNAPTTDPSVPIPCMVWDTDADFWEFARTVWDVCGLVKAEEIDRGQAFLYSEIPCEREVRFVPYEGGNNILDAIVYVTGVSLYQFPCTIQANTTFTVENNTNTYCPVITVENNATLIINQGITLNQSLSPYEQC